jgi:hypothetical protein
MTEPMTITMNHLLNAGLLSVLSVASMAADANPSSDVKAAARALGQQKNYAWVSTPRSEGGTANWRQGPTNGQSEKDGYTCIKFDLGDNTIEAAFKGTKSAIKLESMWTSSSELVDDRAWIAGALKAYRSPAGEAEQLAEAAPKLAKQADGTLSGDLTEEKVKDILLMGRQSDASPKDLKGSVRFWLKEGALAKYEFNVQGKVTGRDGQNYDVNRTTTVEIKDVGATRVQVPDEAKQKL